MSLLSPTPITAALAGAFSALVLPLANGWLTGRLDATIGSILAFLLAVVLPAHAFVVGPGRLVAAGAGAIDKPLLIRVAAWLATAVAVTLLPMALA